MENDSDYTPSDRNIIYAVVPETYVGKHDAVGQSGIYNACSFKYLSPYAFIAESPNGKFTEEEEKEIIAILASFKEV